MIDFDIRPAGRPVPDAEREAILASPGFGQVFTDHMITLRWSAERAVEALLGGDLGGGALAHHAAGPGVRALGALPDHDHVDGLRAAR